jgi:hypothetical protein
MKSISNYDDILDRIGFSNRRGKIIYFIRADEKFIVKGLKSRYNNVLQPEVIKYVIGKKIN